MYHRFAKSLKPSNRTVDAMASNPAGLGYTWLEWFDFYELSRKTTPQNTERPGRGHPVRVVGSLGRKKVGRSAVGQTDKFDITNVNAMFFRVMSRIVSRVSWHQKMDVMPRGCRRRLP
jgi:hypothetical protein